LWKEKAGIEVEKKEEVERMVGEEAAKIEDRRHGLKGFTKDEEILSSKPIWRLVKQAIVDNIGIEILRIDEEDKTFVSLTKYRRDKNIIIPLESVEQIGKKMIQMANEV